MLYWLTGTGASSARYYKDGMQAWGEPQTALEIPMAVAIMPKDNFVPIRRLAEKTNNIVRWTEFPRGGHFAGLEAPSLLVDDLREAFRPYRAPDQSA
jgi:microsomal epoxide hydrolase